MLVGARAVFSCWCRGCPVAAPSLGYRAYCSQAASEQLRVCVVGSGPAGLYCTDRLYIEQVSAKQDRLPTPFGLVRSGVAPDHQHTKNVLKQFTDVVRDPRCQFFGNVRVGKDISLSVLHSLYHAVVLAYGAEGNKHLQIPGQALHGVLSAREFVWWYNGHPDNSDLQLDLSKMQSVAICGLGNVAVDCARVLLQPVERLASTDIAQHALQQLQHSAVKEVHLIGRRGPVQAAFTPKELREILDMDGVQVHISSTAMQSTAVDEAEMKATRMKRRVFDILAKAAQKPETGRQERHLHLHFLRSPSKICDSGSGQVSGIDLEVNELQSNADTVQQKAVGLGQYEHLPAQMVLQSIGYRSLPLEGIPFDHGNGTIPNRLGKVMKSRDSSEQQPGLYVCGWVKRGPTGIIGTNLWDAQQTVDSIMEDFPLNALPQPLLQPDDLHVLLQKNGVKYVDLQGYLNIDKHEIEQGQRSGKPREKVINVTDLLRIAEHH